MHEYATPGYLCCHLYKSYLKIGVGVHKQYIYGYYESSTYNNSSGEVSILEIFGKEVFYHVS
jgi:hypothetical protein